MISADVCGRWSLGFVPAYAIAALAESLLPRLPAERRGEVAALLDPPRRSAPRASTLAEAGIVDPDDFRLDDPATRGELFAVAARLLDRLG